MPCSMQRLILPHLAIYLVVLSGQGLALLYFQLLPPISQCPLGYTQWADPPLPISRSPYRSPRHLPLV